MNYGADSPPPGWLAGDAIMVSPGDAIMVMAG